MICCMSLSHDTRAITFPDNVKQIHFDVTSIFCFSRYHILLAQFPTVVTCIEISH